MGVDSGLPDFRGRDGFWRAYPAIAKLGISFEEMANHDWFDRDPRLAWAFYGHRLNLYRSTTPHIGFSQLLDIGESKPYGYRVLTSNVDGQFQIAGFDDNSIWECHGSINHLQCVNGCGSGIWSSDGVEIEVDEVEFKAVGDLPLCTGCGALARPNILMFGDWGWDGSRTAKQENRLHGWFDNLHNDGAKLVVVEIGAGRSVPTIRMSSEHYVSQLGGVLIRINPRDYQVPAPHISLPMGGVEGIKAILGNML
ncbi:MAG: NAD-dependent deacetylase [Magnetococcales bacterium]|nr:NAD-dependent deacetylase [Magnetococcales bacterium]